MICTPRQNGFTLLETLVVLFILSLVMTLLMQGIANIYRIRTSLGNTIINANPEVLRRQWLQNVMTAMTADSSNGSHKFTGTATEITGLTLSPLLGRSGVATPVQLVINQREDNSCSLIYKEEGQQPLQLGSWQQAECHFSYSSAGNSHYRNNNREKQIFHSNWQYDKKHLLQLPDGILFTVTNNRKEHLSTLFAAVASRKQDRILFSEFLKQ